jgi:tetratricopeptide (TPR) repeat protein
MSVDKSLPPHILSPVIHLKRAGGYFELEMFEHADRELRALPDDETWIKKKKVFQLAIRQESLDWVNMRILARELRHDFPSEEDWWISDAYATRRCETIEEARGVLLDGLAVHNESAIIRYNLACYACVLGNTEESMDFLKEAVRRDEKYKKMAFEDEDLKKVRKVLQKMGWGK